MLLIFDICMRILKKNISFYIYSRTCVRFAPIEFSLNICFITMGSSSSSSSNENSNIEINERFHFRFTDCSCQCNANKRRVGDNDLPQPAFLNAFTAQINRSQYDIRESSERLIKVLLKKSSFRM
jgi:hypothetical protein